MEINNVEAIPPAIRMLHHRAQLCPVLTSQRGAAGEPYRRLLLEGTGDVRSLPVGSANLCLYVEHKQKILFFFF